MGSIGKRHAKIVKEYLPNVKLHIVRSGKGPNVDDPLFDDVPIYNSVSELVKVMLMPLLYVVHHPSTLSSLLS